MFEHRNHPLLSKQAFFARIIFHASAGLLAIATALGVGVGGYHYLGGLSWIDSLVNASMILGGMGPVDLIQTDTGKYFVSFYALFSGLFFIGVATLLLAPFVHRTMHKMHLDT
jgi:hypothetical protein